MDELRLVGTLERQGRRETTVGEFLDRPTGPAGGNGSAPRRWNLHDFQHQTSALPGLLNPLSPGPIRRRRRPEAYRRFI